MCTSSLATVPNGYSPIYRNIEVREFDHKSHNLWSASPDIDCMTDIDQDVYKVQLDNYAQEDAPRYGAFKHGKGVLLFDLEGVNWTRNQNAPPFYSHKLTVYYAEVYYVKQVVGIIKNIPQL